MVDQPDLPPGEPYGPRQPYGPQQPYAQAAGSYSPYPPPVPMYGYRPKTNGFAIASLVLGIVWVYWIGSILALVFGYIARREIRERGESGDGLAVAGIVLGWVGIGILVLVVVLGVFWFSSLPELEPMEPVEV